MPELRSRARRNRTSLNPNPYPTRITCPDKKHKIFLNNIGDKNINKNNKNTNNNRNERKKATVQTRRWRRTGENKRRRDAILFVNQKDDRSIDIVNAVATEKRYCADDEEETIAVKKKTMDDYDSGGRSGDRGAGAEDEGSTAPLPEKV